VVSRVDVQAAVVVAPRPHARPDAGPEAGASSARARPPLRTYVAGEDIELRVVLGGDVAAASPTERRGQGETRSGDVGELCRGQVAALDRVALGTRGDDCAARDEELPGGTAFGCVLGSGRAAGAAEEAEGAHSDHH